LKTAVAKNPRRTPSSELIELRLRLAEAEEALRAIRSGEVDAVVVTGKRGPQVFTLQGAEHNYRVLIESMNEGALTLTADKTILYANQRFARMVKSPLEKVIGGSFRRFLSNDDRLMLRPLLKKKSSSKIQMPLIASDGTPMPVQISIRQLPKRDFDGATVGMVVTDMTAARRSEELLRALTHRVIQAQEIERGRVALELHDGITQLLCGVLFHSQALVDKLSAQEPHTSVSCTAAKQEAVKLRAMLGQTAEEVEHIARNLRPSVLDHLGLAAVLRTAGTEFADRTRVSVKLGCVTLTPRLPAEIELALYRILQEALGNVEKHARARNVTVQLTARDGVVRLTIKDDGIGFDPDRRATRRNGNGGLGLLSMRERAAYVGGAFRIKSISRAAHGNKRLTAKRAGTEIEIRIPLPRKAA